MLVGEIRTEVIAMLGNGLNVAGHPFNDKVYRWITRATNEVPRLAATLKGQDILSIFSELSAEWQGATVAGFSYIGRPSNARFIREVRSFDKVGAFVDIEGTRFVPRRDSDDYNRAVLTGEVANYPQRWTAKGNRLYFGPQPSALYVTDLLLRGAKKEYPEFNDPNQTPILNEEWHQAITIDAARIGAVALGYWEKANQYKQEVRELIVAALSIPLEEEIFEDDPFTFTTEDIGEAY